MHYEHFPEQRSSLFSHILGIISLKNFSGVSQRPDPKVEPSYEMLLPLCKELAFPVIGLHGGGNCSCKQNSLGDISIKISYVNQPHNKGIKMGLRRPPPPPGSIIHSLFCSWTLAVCWAPPLELNKARSLPHARNKLVIIQLYNYNVLSTQKRTAQGELTWPTLGGRKETWAGIRSALGDQGGRWCPLQCWMEQDPFKE